MATPSLRFPVLQGRGGPVPAGGPRAGGRREDHPPSRQTDRVPEALNLPSPCVVVLVGPGASGKSTWAAAHFPPDTVVSSDRLRALVGSGEDDVAASADAFALLEEVVRRRLARRLTTVIDTLGLDADAARRRGWRWPASTACPAWRWPSTPRPRSAGSATGTGPSGSRPTCSPASCGLGGDPGPAARPRGTTACSPRSRCAWCRGRSWTAPPAARRQEDSPAGLRFGLHLGDVHRSAATPRPAGRDRGRRRGGRLRRDLRHGPLPPDPADRPRLGRLPGELHHARLPGRVHRAGAARARWSPA